MNQLADHDQRLLIRSELDRNFIVEAAAGTGKTTELVRRIVAVLATRKARVDSIVAVTFTEKAAGELKLRVREEIELERQEQDPGSTARLALDDAIARLEEARVGTIHGFCADLLRERSIEAVVDPDFVMLNQPESERLFKEAFQLWLQEKLAKPPEGVRRSLRRKSSAAGPRRNRHTTSPNAPILEGDPVARLLRAGWKLAEWRNFPGVWKTPEFPRIPRVDELVDRVHLFSDQVGSCGRPRQDLFYKDTKVVQRLSEDIRTSEAVRPRDYDHVESLLVELADDRSFGAPRKGSGKYSDSISRDEIHRLHADFLETSVSFKNDADAHLAACLHEELQEAVERYESLKRRHGKLDFVDLLLRARDLIRDSPRVRIDFRKRFTHLFVDEFQDTDPLQAEILLLLSATDPEERDWRQAVPEPGKLFLVADPKQSIYRFRRADLGVYLEVKDLLVRHGARFVELTTSFRSVPAIQRAVNAAFAPLMNGNLSAQSGPNTQGRLNTQSHLNSQQADYMPLVSHRVDREKQPGVVALAIPKPYGSRGITQSAMNNSLPEAVGAYVDWLVKESGWKVSSREHPDHDIPIEARHICLLFRRFDAFYVGDVTRPYVQALEARGVRHLMVGGRSFHDREEVETIRTALAAIEWPDDELAIFATLHGALFAIGDEELLEYRHRFKRLHPFRIAQEQLHSRLRPVTDALEFLGALHRQRNKRPIADTVNKLLKQTRAHATFVFRPSGDQVLANVLHIADEARAYEGGGGISFRGFIDRLREEAANRSAPDAPIIEEGADGVRLMTVHRAKGLEFPVVILADITAPLARSRADRFIDTDKNLCALRIADCSPRELLEHQDIEKERDRAEGIRLAYVAATRARDLLVIPAVGDTIWGGGATPKVSSLERWISPMNLAIYPPKSRWQSPEIAANCPAFGHDSVLERPSDRQFDSDCVSPGRHSFPGEPSTPAGKTTLDTQYSVTWWDPHCLRLNVKPLFGLQQESLISKNVDAKIIRQDLVRYQEWSSKQEAAVASGSQPTRVVRTVTEHAALLAEAHARGEREVPNVEVIALPVAPERPTGPRFGALLHAVLATLVWPASPEQVLQASEVQARILGASAEETSAAVTAVVAAMKSDVMTQAQNAVECFRETPMTIRTAEGAYVQGIVDLAFSNGREWTVVDYKSDQELRASLPVYRYQIDLYARAVQLSSGKPAKPLLLRI